MLLKWSTLDIGVGNKLFYTQFRSDGFRNRILVYKDRDGDLTRSGNLPRLQNGNSATAQQIPVLHLRQAHSRFSHHGDKRKVKVLQKHRDPLAEA